MVPKIAAIGPRSIDRETAAFAERVGAYMVGKGFLLASGNAEGSDQAFARGANRVNPKLVRLYLPWPRFNEKCIHPENEVVVETGEDLLSWAGIAVQCHPNPEVLNGPARALLTRNVGIVYESNQVLLASSPRRDGHGGTAHAIRVAEFLNVPVIDLSTAVGRKRVMDKMASG